MKKHSVIGNTLKTKSDPSLAKPHKKGASVEFVQPAKDNKWGRFYFKQFYRYPIIFNDAFKYYEKTLELLKASHEISLDETNSRHIQDKLRDELEINSIKFIVLVKLGFEYLTIELLNYINNVHVQNGGTIQVSWENIGLLERLKILMNNLQISIDIPNIVQTILERRDIIEHPDRDRLYNCKDQEWKNVHLAWVLSGEIERSVDMISTYVEEIMQQFDKFVQKNQRSSELTGLQRGIRSEDPSKGPTKDPYLLRNRYWPAYTWNVQTSYSQNFTDEVLNSLKISREDFSKKYFNIFDKVNASFYHLQRLKENQEIALGIGTELAQVSIPDGENVVGVAGVPYEPIGYEYEAFLGTIKSTLDFLAILVASLFGRKEDDIITLLNSLKYYEGSKDSQEDKVYKYIMKDRFVGLIDSYRNPSKTQKSKRNYATHKGTLPIGTINIPLNNLKASTLLPKALDPNEADPHSTILNATDLVDYCENQFYQTCDLIIGILSLLAGKQLIAGDRGSIYELKVIHK